MGAKRKTGDHFARAEVTGSAIQKGKKAHAKGKEGKRPARSERRRRARPSELDAAGG